MVPGLGLTGTGPFKLPRRPWLGIELVYPSHLKVSHFGSPRFGESQETISTKPKHKGR